MPQTNIPISVYIAKWYLTALAVLYLVGGIGFFFGIMGHFISGWVSRVIVTPYSTVSDIDNSVFFIGPLGTVLAIISLIALHHIFTTKTTGWIKVWYGLSFLALAWSGAISAPVDYIAWPAEFQGILSLIAIFIIHRWVRKQKEDILQQEQYEFKKDFFKINGSKIAIFVLIFFVSTTIVIRLYLPLLSTVFLPGSSAFMAVLDIFDTTTFLSWWFYFIPRTLFVLLDYIYWYSIACLIYFFYVVKVARIKAERTHMEQGQIE